MTIEYILLAIIIILLLVLTIKAFAKNNNADDFNNLNTKLDSIANNNIIKFDAIAAETKRIEESVKKEISLNRIETNNQSLRARQELAASLQSFEEKLNHLTETIDKKLTAFSESNNNNATASTHRNKRSTQHFQERPCAKHRRIQQHTKRQFLCAAE